MNLEKHISELLFEHDCVIVPGFGGFVCNYSSANIHSAKHQFHPPFKKISFNRNLKNNDGLLANQVVQTEGISYSASNQFISEYVAKLSAQLSSDKRFDLKNIGTFYIGEENTLLFEQDETMNYLPESFGLSTFYSPAIKRESIERKIEKKLKDKIIVPSKEKRRKLRLSKKKNLFCTIYFCCSIYSDNCFFSFLLCENGFAEKCKYCQPESFCGKRRTSLSII